MSDVDNVPITGEVSNHKLAAVFDSGATARDAAASMVEAVGLEPAQVQVVAPNEPGARGGSAPFPFDPVSPTLPLLCACQAIGGQTP